MKLQYEFDMARTTIVDFGPLPQRRRCRAYSEMLKARKKERKENAE